MKYLMLFAIALACTAMSNAAQDLPSLKACTAKAATQLALNACASAEDARVNAQMNAVYAQLLKRAGTQQNGVQKVKAAQAAWIAYRNACVAAVFPAADKQQQYGSMYPMRVNLLYAALTVQHIVDLKTLLKEFSGE